jgi:glycosyltransferase involved in cell wall biosynthesis
MNINDIDCEAKRRTLKIDIVVHGRFHGFALGRELINLGHDVLIHTNYPKRALKRFGVSPNHVSSFLAHGIITRTLHKIGLQEAFEPFGHSLFGSWAAKSVRHDADIVYGFSGVMEEVLLARRLRDIKCRMLVRGSAHIREQDRLLQEEEVRARVVVERPSRWIINREEREYELADIIVLLSHFASRTFVEIKPEFVEKIRVNSLGVDVAQFLASPGDVISREKRILSGEPLKVLTVGSFSYRKGMLDLIEVAKNLSGRVNFRFVGDLPLYDSELERGARGLIEMVGRVREPELLAFYREADLFVFPTIEDGFAAVLLQASACGLPVIATHNCSAPEFVIEGKTGWTVPIRDAAALKRHIEWCDLHRAEFASMAQAASQNLKIKSWRAMAEELEHIFYDLES